MPPPKSELLAARKYVDEAGSPEERQLRKMEVFATLYGGDSGSRFTSRVPSAIVTAKKTPGLYLMKGNNLLFLRINETGEVYQVNPRTMKNDGILTDEGWSDSGRTQNMTVYRLEELT